MAEIDVARSRVQMWKRRIALGFAGAVSASFTAIMLLTALLIASGVLEW